MFSKTTLPAGSLAILMAASQTVAHPLVGLDTAIRPFVERRGGIPHTLLTPFMNSAGFSSDINLYDTESFYWEGENGLMANLTAITSDNQKLLYATRMGNTIKSIDCSNPKNLVVNFGDAKSMDEARTSWTWAEADGNDIVLVIDGDECGGQHGRAPYIAKTVSYDDKKLQATLSGQPETWADLVDDYHLHITTNSDGANGGLTRRGSHSISVNKDFSNIQFFQTNIGGIDLGVTCGTCAVAGNIDVDLQITSIKNLDFGATFTTNGFGVSLGLGLKASGSLTSPFDSGNIQFVSVPLGSFEIFGLATFGPELTIDGSASITSIQAQVEADFGVKMTIPDGTKLRVGTGSASDNFNPSFEKIGPKVSGSVEVSASIGPLITLGVSATVFDKGLSMGMAVDGPKLHATLKAEANSAGGVCGDSNKVAGVGIDVDAGLDLNLFAGVGAPADQPNKISVYSTSFDVYNVCLAIDGPGAGQGQGSYPTSGEGANSAVAIYLNGELASKLSVSDYAHAGSCVALQPHIDPSKGSISGIGIAKLSPGTCISVYDDAQCGGIEYHLDNWFSTPNVKAFSVKAC